MNYNYTKQVDLPFTEAIEKTKAALADQGFGVLVEIDMQATLKKKLDVDWDNYVILGACNPPLAYQALQAEREIGLLLPCNVIVYEQDGTVHVSAIVPTAAMSMVANDAVKTVAETVEQKLKAAIDAI